MESINSGPPHLSHFSRKYSNLSALSTGKFTKEIEKLRIFFPIHLTDNDKYECFIISTKTISEIKKKKKKQRKRNGTFERWNIQHSWLFHLIRRSHGDRKTGFWQASSDMYVWLLCFFECVDFSHGVSSSNAENRFTSFYDILMSV